MPLPKNFRNYQAYLAKKKRGPVKAFFHITKNENVPAIEQQGLLANHPNANINSAYQPFRKHGSTGGGVWVTTEPSAFPVYGTTIGGKFDDGSARADALSTFKIEVPVSELPKMLAVQDPYGKNILRKGNDPKAIEPFGTWLGNDVPTTVFLNDMKPKWLKNLGYVEERAPIYPLIETHPEINELKGGWDLSPDADDAELLRHLSKSDLRDYSGLTGHGHGFGTYNKSPQRFVEDYINRNRPIEYRRPRFPMRHPIALMAFRQGNNRGPKHIKMFTRPDVLEPNELKRYSADFIPAVNWTEAYWDYVKPGESIQDRRSYQFAPGAISRGIGGGLPPIKERHFDWNKYKQLVESGKTPNYAAFAAQPSRTLDWDNIVFHNTGYRPALIGAHSFDALSEGAISRGLSPTARATAQVETEARQIAAQLIRHEREESSEYLRRELGRKPTAEEIDNWARVRARFKLKAGRILSPSAAFSTWANKIDRNIENRLSYELSKAIMYRIDHRPKK